MSVGGIMESLQQGMLSGAGRSLEFGAGDDFSSTLTMGQIIKGKVLRHHEGGRYSLSFNGHEKVVDCTFPLRDGEVIYARVIGIDEKIHLQRLAGDHSRSTRDGVSEAGATHRKGYDEYADAIKQLFDRYQAQLSKEEHRLIQKLQNALGGSRRVAVSALILSKLGVALEPALIRAIHRVLADLSAEKPMVLDQPTDYSAARAAGDLNKEMVEGLAALLCSISNREAAPPSPASAGMAHAESDSSRPDFQFLSGGHQSGGNMGQGQNQEHLEWFLGQWLLNAQTGGAVAHRFLRIPIWLQGRLMEVTLALFAQKETADQSKGSDGERLRYRSAVFSLETENLGHLEVYAKLANRHVRIEVTADHMTTAEYLGGKATRLRSVLDAFGWRVDDIRYGVRTKPGGPVEAVIEHFIAQDSLNRLL
jgi:hypothetical protein